MTNLCITCRCPQEAFKVIASGGRKLTGFTLTIFLCCGMVRRALTSSGRDKIMHAKLMSSEFANLAEILT